MLRWGVVVVGLCLLAVVCYWAWGTSVVWQETVVLTGAWGDGPGQFGRLLWDDGTVYGPQSFAVANDGSLVVVADTFNQRVVVSDRGNVSGFSTAGLGTSVGVGLVGDEIVIMSPDALHRFSRSGRPLGALPLPTEQDARRLSVDLLSTPHGLTITDLTLVDDAFRRSFHILDRVDGTPLLELLGFSEMSADGEVFSRGAAGLSVVLTSGGVLTHVPGERPDVVHLMAADRVYLLQSPGDGDISLIGQDDRGRVYLSCECSGKLLCARYTPKSGRLVKPNRVLEADAGRAALSYQVRIDGLGGVYVATGDDTGYSIRRYQEKRIVGAK